MSDQIEMWAKKHIPSAAPWKKQRSPRAKSVASICCQDFYDTPGTLSRISYNPLRDKVKAFYEMPLSKDKKPDFYAYCDGTATDISKCKITSVFGRLQDDEDDMRVKTLGKGWSSTLSASGSLRKNSFQRTGDLSIQDLKK